jgi:hypothetical protein
MIQMVPAIIGDFRLGSHCVVRDLLEIGAESELV